MVHEYKAHNEMDGTTVAISVVGLTLAAGLLYFGYLATGTSKQCREFRRNWKLKMKKGGARKSKDKYKGTVAGAGSSATDKRQG